MVQWKYLVPEIDLDPESWGWKSESGILTPVMTNQPAAPDDILKFIRCKCKSTTRNPCSSNICSCKKNGFNRVKGCGDCHGESCRNSVVCLTEEEVSDVSGDRNIFDVLFDE